MLKLPSVLLLRRCDALEVAWREGKGCDNGTIVAGTVKLEPRALKQFTEDLGDLSNLRKSAKDKQVKGAKHRISRQILEMEEISSLAQDAQEKTQERKKRKTEACYGRVGW